MPLAGNRGPRVAVEVDTIVSPLVQEIRLRGRRLRLAAPFGRVVAITAGVVKKLNGRVDTEGPLGLLPVGQVLVEVLTLNDELLVPPIFVQHLPAEDRCVRNKMEGDERSAGDHLDRLVVQ